MKFKEVRTIEKAKVREMCDKDDLGLCTIRETDEEYKYLFELCDKEANLENLEKMANDILDHSNWNRAISERCTNELIGIIIAKLINECCRTNIEMVEE